MLFANISDGIINLNFGTKEFSYALGEELFTSTFAPLKASKREQKQTENPK